MTKPPSQTPHFNSSRPRYTLPSPQTTEKDDNNLRQGKVSKWTDGIEYDAGGRGKGLLVPLSRIIQRKKEGKIDSLGVFGS